MDNLLRRVVVEETRHVFHHAAHCSLGDLLCLRYDTEGRPSGKIA